MTVYYAYETVDSGHHTMTIIGPVDPGLQRRDGWPWEDPFLVTNPKTNEPLLFDFVTAFDHTPSESEIFHLIPEEYRAQYAEKFANYITEQIWEN